MTEENIKKIGFGYLVSGSCVMMLITVLIYLSYLSPYDMRKMNSFISENFIISYLGIGAFFLSVINIPVFAITGLVLLFKRRTILLALVLLTVTAIFVITARMVEDGW